MSSEKCFKSFLSIDYLHITTLGGLEPLPINMEEGGGTERVVEGKGM